jgi:hypothetical protein
MVDVPGRADDEMVNGFFQGRMRRAGSPARFAGQET